MMTRGGTLVVVALALLAAGAGRAERYAVLPVDAARDTAGQPLAAARAVRDALRAQKRDVVDEDATRRTFEDYLHRGGSSIESYKKRFDQSEAALAALDQDKSVQILESLIANLADDPDFSTEKQALLESARLKLATRLVGLAGQRENGRAETPQGQRARDLLADALRANPQLSPSKDQFPPRFFDLLNLARARVDEFGRGGLNIDSRPQGATVFLEGRALGRTPLVLGPDVLPRGKYRLWLESDGTRSVTTLVYVDATPEPVFVDLAFDGSLWQEGPGLRPPRGASIDDAVARKLGGFLGADVLVLLGTTSYDADEGVSLWGAAFSVAEGEATRRGAVLLGPDVALDRAATELATFLAGGEAGRVEERPLPPAILPLKPGPAVAATSQSGPMLSLSGGRGGGEGGELPWLTIGIVAGAVGLVAVAAAGAIAAVALAPRDGAFTVAVEDLP